MKSKLKWTILFFGIFAARSTGARKQGKCAIAMHRIQELVTPDQLPAVCDVVGRIPRRLAKLVGRIPILIYSLPTKDSSQNCRMIPTNFPWIACGVDRWS